MTMPLPLVGNVNGRTSYWFSGAMNMISQRVASAPANKAGAVLDGKFTRL